MNLNPVSADELLFKPYRLTFRFNIEYPRMKRILCPTDFSESAQNAVQYAGKLAQKLNAAVTLFNVKSVFDFAPSEVLRSTKMTLEGVSEELRELAKEVSDVFKIPCYAEVQPSGSPLSEIISHRALEFDLIVMGTSGPEDLFEFVTGSNTYKVIRKASVPVLFIPNGYTYADIRHTVYAFDYLNKRELPVSQLKYFLEHFEGDLLILQVIDEKDITDIESVKAELKTQLQEAHGDSFKMKIETISASDVALGIHSFALRNDADLVALCVNDYTFMERLFRKSVIKQISGIAEYPVFAFHN